MDMQADGARKLEAGVRRLGSALRGFGEQANEALKVIADGLAVLSGGPEPSDAKKPRVQRLRSLPVPATPPSELDRARAERELRKRGILGED